MKGKTLFRRLCFVLAFLGVAAAVAPEKPPSEYDVMAAYLYNFGKFVRWPEVDTPRPGGTFDLCVIGRDPFGAKLDAVVQGGTIGGLATGARRIHRPEDAKGCRILFVSSSEEKALEQLLESTKGQAMLTVSDIPSFAERHGMIGFVLYQRRVRFEINLEAVDGAGLQVSSELLKVAQTVRRAEVR